MQDKIYTGIVKNKVGSKTVKVKFKANVRHEFYDKVIRYEKTRIVHDEDNTAEVGQTVFFTNSRPLSRTKNYILVKKNK